MIGVYGGTFDPVHYGHLRTALEVHERLNLEQLRLVPCKSPLHRDEPLASAKHRLKMLQLAVKDEPKLMIDTCELDRSGPSFMVDTLTKIRSEVGENSSIALIVGLDAFLSLPRWSRWEQLFKLAHLVVMTRPGWHFKEKEAQDWVAEKIEKTPARIESKAAGMIHFLEVTQLEISATAIRLMVQAEKDPRYLLPEAVRELIFKENLYR